MSSSDPAPRLLGLYVAAFVSTLGMFLVLALLPYYAQRFGATPGEVGALVSVFSLAQMLSAPLWGRISDRVGRRPVILAGLLVSAVAFVTFAYADSLWLLFACRFAQGVGGGTVAAIFAYISDAVAPEDRAERIGWVTAATSGAALIGPAIGSIAARWSAALPGLVAAALSVFAWALCLAMLQERRRRSGEPAAASEARPGLLRAVLDVLARPFVAAHLLIWIYCLGMFGNTAMTAVAALDLERRFGVGENDIWVFFAALAGGAMLVRLLVLGRVVRALGEARTLRLGALSFVLGLASFPLVPALAGVLATVVLMAVGTSFLFPCTTALISRTVEEPSASGQLLGVQQAYGGVSGIAGPLVAGLGFGRIGPASPFLIGAAALAAATLLSLSVRQPGRPASG